jgi:hypothetical protein
MAFSTYRVGSLPCSATELGEIDLMIVLLDESSSHPDALVIASPLAYVFQNLHRGFAYN